VTAYFVTRHAGTREWAARQGYDAQIVAHVDPETIRPGDVVLGTLPAHLAAEICTRGGRYFHLALDLPAEMRGRDLSADDMKRLGARLIEIEARFVGAKPALG